MFETIIIRFISLFIFIILPIIIILCGFLIIIDTNNIYNEAIKKLSELNKRMEELK